MKKTILLTAACIGILSMASCTVEDFTCECTYVATVTGPSAGQPNRVETTVVKGRLHEQAEVECAGLQSKYMAEFFSGTCLIK